ncbi:MAG: hypothetical protein H7Z76_01950, partial [Methylotenera sp.]|nr:hypothetical protein [Flavobacterium sp.]
MKKNKPTYITDLTTEIMNNRDLLNAWAKNSVDMEFLDLSVDILSDLDLLFSWDCNNLLSVKLAGILSDNQDFKWKDGILIKIDELYKFPIKPSEYKKIIKEMIDAESINSIIRKDKLNQGQSLEQIKKDERDNRIASYIDVFEKSKGYEQNDYKFLNEKVLPIIIERNNELKRQFLEKKADEFGFPNHNELLYNENNSEKMNDDNVELPENDIVRIEINKIALLHWYNGKGITRSNHYKIALDYGYTAKTSGEGLYQDYIYYSKNSNRLASGETKIKLSNKIKLFESVIDLLINENAIKKAKSELA